MSGRTELLLLLSSHDSVSLYYWISLLNFFDEYQTELNIVDLRLLVASCEECREYFNQNNTDKIRKEETNPDIYSHLEMLERAEVLERKREMLRIEYNTESLSTDQMVAIAQ